MVTVFDGNGFSLRHDADISFVLIIPLNVLEVVWIADCRCPLEVVERWRAGIRDVESRKLLRNYRIDEFAGSAVSAVPSEDASVGESGGELVATPSTEIEAPGPRTWLVS